MLQKLRNFCAREEIRGRLILTILSLIVLAYTLVAVFGRALPADNPDTPWIPGCTRNGSWRCWLHLASVGMQRGWLSGGRN